MYGTLQLLEMILGFIDNCISKKNTSFLHLILNYKDYN